MPATGGSKQLKGSRGRWNQSEAETKSELAIGDRWCV